MGGEIGNDAMVTTTPDVRGAAEIAGPSTPDRPAPLRIAGLRKTYGTRVILDDIDLTLRTGTVTGLLGPNGAGKTTTLRAIGGLLRPDSGEVLIFGESSAYPAARARLGYLPADPVFVARLTGEENLDLLAKLRAAAPSAVRQGLLDKIGLSAADLRRPVGDYSSGMRQKLGIVGALQHSPGLVVMDEPANRLDPIAQNAFASIVRDAAAAGAAVLLSSHLLGEVEEICGIVVMMNEGKFLQTLEVDELRRRAARRVTVVFENDARALPGVEDPVVDGAILQGTMPARRPDLLQALAATPGVVDVLVEPASLEQLFLRTYGDRR